MLDFANRFSNDAELLLDEFTHRINNEFAILIATVSCEALAARGGVLDPSLQRIHNRLLNVARMNRALQAPHCDEQKDVGEYLDQLCRNIRIATLGDIVLQYAGCSFLLEADRCWRLGLVLSELIENARRHAFHDRGGSITVALTATDSETECTIADDGCGHGTATAGRGLTIVNALVDSLRGRLTGTSGHSGTSWVVTIPR